jgi:protein-L-isoaspartate(D-aspartate) O-methyltransferase
MTFLSLRNKMIDEQLIPRGIRDPRVLDAMRLTPRHEFIPEEFRSYAYDDSPVPIGEGQTISQPFMVAYMTQALQLNSEDKVLEIGTGSGYQTSILARLVKEVYTIERIEELSMNAQKILRKMLHKNIHFYVGDGSEVFKDLSLRFNAIMVTAAIPQAIEPLFDRLEEGGRLIAPIGGRSEQILKLFRRSDGRMEEENLGGCVFVPLIGKYGWN